MKKILFIFVLATLSLTACKDKAKKEHDNTKTENVAQTDYACPMKCEGDKKYHKPGKCPTCGMELKKVN